MNIEFGTMNALWAAKREVFMSSRNQILKVRLSQLALLVSMLAILNACGSTASQSTLGSSQLGGGGILGAGTAVAHPGNIYNLPDAPSYVSETNGASGAVPSSTYAIHTSRTLKVKVSPLNGPNLTLKGYTNWSFPYGCFRTRVTVNGQTQTTQILRVDGQSQGATSVCANSPTYQVLDFTNAVTGNGTTSVVISNAEYDNCRYTWPLNYGCQMSPIFQNHMAAAIIQIQGDNTWMDY
jgi:hypothetical protein